MMVEIREGQLSRKIVGNCASYKEALDLAIRTLRRLESMPMFNPNQWVEIFDGDILRMSAKVGTNRSKR